MIFKIDCICDSSTMSKTNGPLCDNWVVTIEAPSARIAEYLVLSNYPGVMHAKATIAEPLSFFKSLIALFRAPSAAVVFTLELECMRRLGYREGWFDMERGRRPSFEDWDLDEARWPKSENEIPVITRYADGLHQDRLIE